MKFDLGRFNWSQINKNQFIEIVGADASSKRGNSLVLMEPQLTLNENKTVRIKCTDVVDGVYVDLFF